MRPASYINYINLKQLTSISNRMKLNAISLLLFILCQFFQCSIQQFAEQQVEGQRSNHAEDVRMEGVGYLRNVQRLDMLINFLHCNKTVGWEQLKAINEHLIYQTRGGYKQNSSVFQCHSQNYPDFEQPENFQCWFCPKKFKNNTYLALHYLLRHRQSFPSPQNMKDIPSQDLTAMEIILRHKIYQFIGPNQLQILFSSLAVQNEIYQYCTALFSKVFELYWRETPPERQQQSRYKHFMEGKDSQELCRMIALKMYETNIWIDIARYIGLTILLFCGVAFCVHLYTQKKEQIRQKRQFRYKLKKK